MAAQDTMALRLPAVSAAAEPTTSITAFKSKVVSIPKPGSAAHQLMRTHRATRWSLHR
jgi:hypothetical protein